MISLLCPTRKRPENVKRLWESIAATADVSDLELILYVDEDDNSYDDLNIPCLIVRGPRIVLSEMWNKCYEKANGDILGHIGDDIIYRTDHWDSMVKSEFRNCSDKILFVFGRDGSGHDGVFGTHGFISRKWAETVGYFVPPYFSSDFNDTWLNDVAMMIGRHRFVDFLNEHMHYTFGKADFDVTHQERVARGSRDDVVSMYNDKFPERLKDAEKLRKVMQ